MEWSNVWVIIAIFISCCGIVAIGFVAGLFYRKRDTPIIRASGKELSLILLIGVLLSYLAPFSFIVYPTAFSCGIVRFMLGLSYTISYVAILVKTNRIFRVFNLRKTKRKQLRFIDIKSQLVLTFGLVFVEVVIITTWTIFDTPKVAHVYLTKADNIRVCGDSSDFAYLGAMVYPLVLLFLCVYFAIKTRKTPDGFNETFYIAFSSYAICILWIAFLSIYFLVTNNTIRIVALCLSSNINATVLLSTLFLTRAYVVLFKPEKNTKDSVIGRLSSPSKLESK